MSLNSPRTLALAGAAVLCAAAAGFALTQGGADAPSMPIAMAAETQAAAAPATQATAPIVLAQADTAEKPAEKKGVATGVMVYGDPEAPVTIIEYVSLTCPHCATFHTGIYQDIKKNYIDTGKAKLELREVYFDAYGFKGALLARCGGGKRYWQFIDYLLRTQRDWTSQGDVDAALTQVGRLGGLGAAEIKACLSDEQASTALIRQFQEFRQDKRLTGTPTIIVGEDKISPLTYDNVAEAIDDAL